MNKFIGLGKAMDKPWESDNCAAIRSLYAVFSVPQAAALWCGVPEEDVEMVLAEAASISTSGEGRGIWKHPAVPCLEHRSRAITDAILRRVLPFGREDGKPVAPTDQVAVRRRHVTGRALRTWMETELPNEKPAFLFDEIERNTHTSISIETFQVLEAENKKLETRLENAKVEYTKLRAEKEALELDNQRLATRVDQAEPLSDRAEATYLNIIGAMLDLMLSKSPAGNPYSSFNNQAAIVTALMANYSETPGISQRTLNKHFARATRNLRRTDD